MSRAIRIQRPKPNVHDLTDIVMRLGVGVALEPETRHRVFESLAQAYDKYQQRQRIPNFHGLRDYYSFAKNLGGCEQLTPRSVQFAFARNFSGGEETENERHILFWQFLSGIFEEMEWNIDTVENANKIDVAECIHANLCDCNARHLLVIGNTDIAIDILEYGFVLYYLFLKKWSAFIFVFYFSYSPKSNYLFFTSYFFPADIVSASMVSILWLSTVASSRLTRAATMGIVSSTKSSFASSRGVR